MSGQPRAARAETQTARGTPDPLPSGDIKFRCVPAGRTLKRLIAYLLDHLRIDIQGDLSLAQLRQMVDQRGSMLARLIMLKATSSDGMTELQEGFLQRLNGRLRSGLSEQVIANELRCWADDEPPDSACPSVDTTSSFPSIRPLVRFLLANLIIDLDGDLSAQKVRELLSGESSEEARVLLRRLDQESDRAELVIDLIDGLQEHLITGFDEGGVRAQILKALSLRVC